MKKINRIYYFLLLSLFLGQIGCRKFIEVSPPVTSITGASAYASNATAVGVLTGLYTQMANARVSDPGDISSLTMFAGVSADEFAVWTNQSANLTLQAYYKNALSASLKSGTEYWSQLYQYIFKCNASIEGLNSSTSLDPEVKQQLLGEAKFMRAYFYFYLVNMYGDVPVPLTSDYSVNISLGRAASANVYVQIIRDLHDAQKLLNAGYTDGSLLKPSLDRVRPTSWAATAMLARSYLYSGNWTGADSASSVLINNTDLFALSSLDTTFLRASLNGNVVNKEAIWQLQPVKSSPANTLDGAAYIIPPAGPGTGLNYGVYLSNALVNSFDSGDNRKTHWVGNITFSGDTLYYPFKYKVNSTAVGTPVTEHFMLLRLGEQYLTRAEARAHEGNIGGAQADINAIRGRAGLGPTNASTQADLLAVIQHERQVELFAELGHRWFDLKRTGAVDAVMQTVTPAKGGTWNSGAQLYPIPASDILLDPGLTQNQGY